MWAHSLKAKLLRVYEVKFIDPFFIRAKFRPGFVFLEGVYGNTINLNPLFPENHNPQIPFWGQSENVVKTQVWIAVSVYVLVAVA